MLCWISGGASTSRLFCPAFGTTRVLPTSELTSVCSPAPAPRLFCHGNLISPAEPEVVAPLGPPASELLLVAPDPPVVPPPAVWKSMPVRPSCGGLMPVPVPASESSAFRISATCTAFACFRSTFSGRPLFSGWSICLINWSSHLKLSGVLVTTSRRFESGYASMRKTLVTATSAPLASPLPPPPARVCPPVWRCPGAPPAAPPEKGREVRLPPPLLPPSSSELSRSFTFSGSVYFRSYRRKGSPSLVIGTSHAVLIRRSISRITSGSARTVMELVAGSTVTTSCSLVPRIRPSPLEPPPLRA